MEPDSERPGRRTLALLTIPIVGLIVLSNIGSALAPSLVDEHPLWLLALNSQNRHLILTTNSLDAWSYYLVGTARLLVADPLFFLLGHWYGDAALQWLEKRTKTFGQVIRDWEHLFRHASYPIVFLAPNQYVCMFAGAAGMSVQGFWITNLLGTVVRLYLIRRIGESFEAPLDDVLGWIGDHRGPLLAISIVTTLVFLVNEMRGGGPGLDELEDLAEAAESGHGVAPADPPTEPTTEPTTEADPTP